MRNGSGGPDARNAGQALRDDHLRLAVERGIISAAQRDALLALAGEAAVAPAPPRRREAVTISFAQVLYWAGALAVLFALGYFLVDRWKSLRPGGVLGVTLLYAAAFILASWYLTRSGQRLAGSIFALLAVAMAPIVTWSLESLAGIWPERPVPISMAPFMTDPIATIRWIPVELSAALAGLIVVRRVRFPLLVLSVTVPFAWAFCHLTPIVFDAELDFAIWGWMAILAATILLLAGAELDRRARDADYAVLSYLTAMILLWVGVSSVADQSRAIPHSLPALVAGLGALSFLTRRGLFLLFAAIGFVSWLGFLATDVFPTATGFMIVAVAAGGVLILGTVLVQRRYPELARSFARDAEPRREFRGSRLAYATAIGIAFVLVATARVRAPDLLREKMAREREQARLSAQRRRAQPTPPAPPTQTAPATKGRTETPTPPPTYY